jgi:eukaryotic-like serine/threonine-protein kinase
VDLCAGEAETAYRHVAQAWPVLEQSLVLRVHALAVLCLRTRAACAIAASQGAADPGPLLAIAEHDLRQLQRAHYSAIWTKGWPQILRAEIAARRGDQGAALAHLDRGIDAFRDRGAAFFLAIARRTKGLLVGGDEGRGLIAEADAWMAGEGIINPARLAATFVPGIPSSATP